MYICSDFSLGHWLGKRGEQNSNKKNKVFMKAKHIEINGVRIGKPLLPGLPRNKCIGGYARENRKKHNMAEVVFWKQVHQGKFHGIDFTRQLVIGNYIADFCVRDLGLVVEVDGEKKPVYWGEGTVMTNYQVNVEYTHSDTWNGYKQKCFAGIYDKLYSKLEAGEDVTIVFYGDSCTYGAASSFAYGYAPKQYSYALLVTNALADIFGYTVHYEKSKLSGTGPMPKKDYVAGDRGTITYINNSVGGWTTSDGVNNFDKHAKTFIEKFGCDLFVVDLGGNDGSLSPEKTAENDVKIIGKVREIAPDSGIIIISTLLNRPGSNWAGNDALQEPYLVELSEKLRDEGVPCAVCGITSMTASVLEHIKFEDFSGNNINHPNDFWARLYANTLFETLVGYENLN